jgi:ACS family hexuronate transporter-like MFS transporter
MLGLGEGGCFPGAIKAVIEWVPKTRHAMANGIAIGGSALGAVAAPPLCVYLLGITGWRAIFLITGGFGFIWLIAWLISTKIIQQSTNAQVTDIAREKEMQPARIKFRELLSNKEVRVFVLIRFLLDPIFYFYMFWIPKFLNETHSLSMEMIGSLLWIPFLALGAGNVLGGWFSDIIFTRSSNINLARKLVMGVAAALTSPVILIGFIPHYPTVIVLMTLAFFAHGLWITNYITIIGDLFGKKVTSTVVGLSGSAGAVSALILNPLIGYVVMHFSYNSLWWYSGVMYPLAFIILMRIIPTIKPVSFPVTGLKGV